MTCGEHIWIEPTLFEKFFEGACVSPRHIMVELDGKESYDVYYTWDVQSVFDTVEAGMKNRPDAPPIVARRPFAARQGRQPRRGGQGRRRAGLRDGRQRRSVKQALVERAGEVGADASLDLLRLAVLGLDPEAARAARSSLATSDSPRAVGLINQVLNGPVDEGEREGLIAALDRIGEKSRYARLLGVVQRGLSGDRSTIDTGSWRAAAGEVARSAEGEDLEARQARLDAAVRAAENGGTEAQLDACEAFLTVALSPGTSRDFRGLMTSDARRYLDDAVALGATGWRVDALASILANERGDAREAFARAVAAVEALPSGAADWTAISALRTFVDGRRAAIRRAVRAREDWSPQWLADVCAAYRALADYPTATDRTVVEHYDFLWDLGALGEAARVLREGVLRFPGSRDLHDRFRGLVLEQRGVDGLEPEYDALIASDGAPRILEWYRAFATLVTAEYHRRAVGLDAATAAYERASARFESLESDDGLRAASRHYRALCRAGLARMALERGDLDTATHELVAALGLTDDPSVPDGLNLTPSDTSRTLRASLTAAGRTELLAELEAALAKIDPALLQLPAYEKPAVPERGNPRSGGEDSGETGPGDGD
ncbi:MAG: hypothetical protein R3F34_00705 [Planctomycetota bacterium]